MTKMLWFFVVTFMISGFHCIQGNNCEFEEPDETYLSMPNRIVNISCLTINPNLSPQLKINDAFVAQGTVRVPADLRQGISFEIVKFNNMLGYIVSVFANISHNYTSIECFSGCSSSVHSAQWSALIIVVDSLPDPPDLQVMVLDNTQMFLSWQSPWSYPVNNYTLSITQSTTGSINRSLFITPNTTFILNKADLNASCVNVQLAIRFHTDVGSSNWSETANKSFPKDVSSINFNYSVIHVDIVKFSGQLKLHIAMHIQPMTFCEYETVVYQYTIINDRTQKEFSLTLTDDENYTVNLSRDFLLSDDTFSVVLFITNEANQYIEDVELLLNETLSSVNSYSYSMPSPLKTNTESNEPQLITSGRIGLIVIFGSSVAALIVLASCAITAMLMINYIKKRSRKRVCTINERTFQNMLMVPNAQYIPNAQYSNEIDHIYEDIRLSDLDIYNQSNMTNTSDDNNLPNNNQLQEDKQLSNCVSQDEYVQMSPLSQSNSSHAQHRVKYSPENTSSHGFRKT